jgi:hypothetical protein
MNMSLSQHAVLLGKKRAMDLAEKDETPLQKEFKRRMLSTLCNVPLNRLDDDSEPIGIFAYGGRSSQIDVENQFRETRSGKIMRISNPYALDVLRSIKLGSDAELNTAAQHSVASKVFRKVPREQRQYPGSCTGEISVPVECLHWRNQSFDHGRRE